VDERDRVEFFVPGEAAAGLAGDAAGGVWIVILPSMPGSTVYLTERISPRMVLPPAAPAR
jgi:hypothetical protein